MKIKILLAAALMACSSIASAATVIWEPTSSGTVTVNTFNLSGWDLGLFDDSDAFTDANALILGVSDEISFSAAGSGDWYAIRSTGDTKLLSGSKQFALAITDGTDWFEAVNAIQQAAGTSNYEVFFSNGISDVFTFDATPTVIPVPAAVWLFGSGLIGLAGIARRKKA